MDQIQAMMSQFLSLKPNISSLQWNSQKSTSTYQNWAASTNPLTNDLSRGVLATTKYPIIKRVNVPICIYCLTWAISQFLKVPL